MGKSLAKTLLKASLLAGASALYVNRKAAHKKVTGMLYNDTINAAQRHLDTKYPHLNFDIEYDGIVVLEDGAVWRVPVHALDEPDDFDGEFDEFVDEDGYFDRGMLIYVWVNRLTGEVEDDYYGFYRKAEIYDYIKQILSTGIDTSSPSIVSFELPMAEARTITGKLKSGLTGKESIAELSVQYYYKSYLDCWVRINATTEFNFKPLLKAVESLGMFANVRVDIDYITALPSTIYQIISGGKEETKLIQLSSGDERINKPVGFASVQMDSRLKLDFNNNGRIEMEWGTGYTSDNPFGKLFEKSGIFGKPEKDDPTKWMFTEEEGKRYRELMDTGMTHEAALDIILKEGNSSKEEPTVEIREESFPSVSEKGLWDDLDKRLGLDNPFGEPDEGTESPFGKLDEGADDQDGNDDDTELYNDDYLEDSVEPIIKGEQEESEETEKESEEAESQNEDDDTELYNDDSLENSFETEDEVEQREEESENQDEDDDTELYNDDSLEDSFETESEAEQEFIGDSEADETTDDDPDDDSDSLEEYLNTHSQEEVEESEEEEDTDESEVDQDEYSNIVFVLDEKPGEVAEEISTEETNVEEANAEDNESASDADSESVIESVSENSEGESTAEVIETEEPTTEDGSVENIEVTEESEEAEAEIFFRTETERQNQPSEVKKQEEVQDKSTEDTKQEEAEKAAEPNTEPSITVELDEMPSKKELEGAVDKAVQREVERREREQARLWEDFKKGTEGNSDNEATVSVNKRSSFWDRANWFRKHK